jgi:hypothetical protein
MKFVEDRVGDVTLVYFVKFQCEMTNRKNYHLFYTHHGIYNSIFHPLDAH